MRLLGRTTLVAAAALATSLGCGGDDPVAANGDEAPNDLSATGLYADFASKTIAPTARAYAPGVAFWSDGLDKDRYIQLPEGTTIDATKVDDWKLPVGTKVWKDIHKGPKKVETRYFQKVLEATWLQTTYVWSEDGTKATKVDDGADITVDGQPYHIPKSTECGECHRGRKDKLLGFEAVSLALSTATGVTLGTLVTEKKIVPPPARTTVTLPDPAYAVLHINCGVTCHNPTPTSTAASTGFRLRLGFDEIATKPEKEWDMMGTAIGVETSSPGRAGLRIKAGSPDESSVVQVMSVRGDGQMPPLATTIVDTKGVEAVSSWIKGLK